MNRLPIACCLVVALFLGCSSAGRAAAGPPGRRFQNLPAGWREISHYRASGQQIHDIGVRLFAKLTSLTNTKLRTPHGVVQVNILTTASDKDAERLLRQLRRQKSGLFAFRSGDVEVVEFVTRSSRAAVEARYVLGFQPRSMTYDVTMQVATAELADGHRASRVFGLLVSARQRGLDDGLQGQIRRDSKGMVFGSSICLRTIGPKGAAPTFIFQPLVKKKASLVHGDVTMYTFAKMPNFAGIPFVRVRARISVRAFQPVATDRKAGPELLAATKDWPCRDEKIVALAKRLTVGAKTNRDKAERILAWCVPGKNLQFGGPVGSRIGVTTFLQKKVGQCWDFADLFVTLARSAGVPCRQVAGWLVGESGHVWAEVLLEGQGWWAVDPTAGAPCGSRHVPWFTTETGQMPILYTAMPEIAPAK